jgi:serine protease Do
MSAERICLTKRIMNKRIALTNLALLFAALPAFAQAATPAAPVPPPAPPAAVTSPVAPNESQRPTTFLGVETSGVPHVVCEQLGLPRGFGLVVDYVVPDSAAAKAGVQENDILRLLNDQMLVSADQLGKLVRSFPVGTTVNLTILRKGQEIKLPVVLQKHESKNGRDEWGFENDFRFEDLPRVEDMHLPDMTTVREAVAHARTELAHAGEQTREAMRKFRVVTSDDDGERSTHVDFGKAQIVYSDGKGELKLQNVDGKKTLTAKDQNGKVLFQGPVDTEQERQSMPPEVRERFKNLQQQNIPPMPPDSKLAPDKSEPDESARRPAENIRATACVPNERSGWVRNTILL